MDELDKTTASANALDLCAVAEPDNRLATLYELVGDIEIGGAVHENLRAAQAKRGASTQWKMVQPRTTAATTKDHQRKRSMNGIDVGPVLGMFAIAFVAIVAIGSVRLYFQIKEKKRREEEKEARRAARAMARQQARNKR